MLKCPVCLSESFDTFGGRPGARCTQCGALERGRLAWLVLQALDLLRPGVRMMNIAPETFMLFKAGDLLGAGYSAFDYDPEQWVKWKRAVARIDLCLDLAEFVTGQFDVIMHNHVMEHVPCDVPGVLRRLNDRLVPGGYHLFSVPIRTGVHTTEDLSDTLSPEERRARFGQEDHVRIFGSIDLDQLLVDAGMADGQIALSALTDEEQARQAGIPAGTLTTRSSNSLFVWRKPLA